VYHFSDLVLTIGGTAFSIKTLELSIDNQIGDIYENSVVKSRFESSGLRVGLRVTCGYRSDTKALYRKAIAGDAGTLVMSNGVNVYTFTFPDLKIPGRGPTIPESGEVTFAPEIMAYATASTNVLSIAKS